MHTPAVLGQDFPLSFVPSVLSGTHANPSSASSTNHPPRLAPKTHRVPILRVQSQRRSRRTTSILHFGLVPTRRDGQGELTCMVPRCGDVGEGGDGFGFGYQGGGEGEDGEDGEEGLSGEHGFQEWVVL